MATVISIQIGATTFSKTYQDDTKAQAVLTAFFEDHKLAGDPPDTTLTNRQKMERIIDFWVRYMTEKARLRQMQLVRDASRAQTEGDLKFE